ncbi:MAG: 4-(cytidine 5'-diphospho)-2-C-methyl-D-erythritol kinase [Candidatus Gracilibacteria bacterium]
MLPFTLKSPAKVNLTLDVLGRDPSGYHRIQTIFAEVPSLADELIFEKSKEPGITIQCDKKEVPIGSENLIMSAIEALLAHVKKDAENFQGFTIKLIKNIPPGGGLGGASSNAATTLKALNKLWDLQLSTKELLEIAAQIGMDVPFFIHGGLALGSHYGEQITPLPVLKNFTIEIIQTHIPVLTKDAYEFLDLNECGKRTSDTEILLEILKNKSSPLDSKILNSLLHNDFESQFFTQNPEIKKQYPNAHLSGSGGCLFEIKGN